MHEIYNLKFPILTNEYFLQAGNVIRLEAESPWMCDQREMWEDNPEVAEFVNNRMRKANGEAWDPPPSARAWRRMQRDSAQ